MQILWCGASDLLTLHITHMTKKTAMESKLKTLCELRISVLALVNQMRHLSLIRSSAFGIK